METDALGIGKESQHKEANDDEPTQQRKVALLRIGIIAVTPSRCQERNKQQWRDEGTLNAEEGNAIGME